MALKRMTAVDAPSPRDHRHDASRQLGCVPVVIQPPSSGPEPPRLGWSLLLSCGHRGAVAAGDGVCKSTGSRRRTLDVLVVIA